MYKSFGWIIAGLLVMCAKTCTQILRFAARIHSNEAMYDGDS